MFKRSRLNSIFIFIISQDYHELLNCIIRADENIYHNFKQNNFRGVRNLNQDKASMDVSLKQFKI